MLHFTISIWLSLSYLIVYWFIFLSLFYVSRLRFCHSGINKELLTYLLTYCIKLFRQFFKHSLKPHCVGFSLTTLETGDVPQEVSIQAMCLENLESVHGLISLADNLINVGTNKRNYWDRVTRSILSALTRLIPGSRREVRPSTLGLRKILSVDSSTFNFSTYFFWTNRNLWYILMAIEVSTIGFTAGLTKDFSTPGIVKFDAIIRNAEHGYNPSTGVFTAPRSGSYFFSMVTYPEQFVICSNYYNIHRGGSIG